jgi:hypothetical protein
MPRPPAVITATGACVVATERFGSDVMSQALSLEAINPIGCQVERRLLPGREVGNQPCGRRRKGEAQMAAA